MAMNIDFKNEQLNKLCERYNVKELYLFGSAASGSISRESDLDFIVNFNRKEYDGAFDQFIEFKQALEEIYDRAVDLYHQRKFRNSIFQDEVERTRKLLYAKQEKKTPA